MRLTQSRKSLIFNLLWSKVISKCGDDFRIIPSAKNVLQNSITECGNYYVFWYGRKLENGSVTHGCEMIEKTKVNFRNKEKIKNEST